MSNAFGLTSTNEFQNAFQWQGRSGRAYDLTKEPLEDLNMSGHGLYLLAIATPEGEKAIWVGTSDSLIHDDQSRRAFLKAVHRAEFAYSYELGAHETVPPTLVWDLEAATLRPERRAA